jgi:hypothetical protein
MRLDFVDLTDTPLEFYCNFAGDGVEYWDYAFSAVFGEEHHYRSLSSSEIEQLRENCQRILSATAEIDGVY